MTAPRRSALLLVAASITVGGLTACGDDRNGSDSDGAATTSAVASSTASTEAPTTAAPATTELDPASTTTEVDLGDEEEGLGDLEALVPQLLIAAGDLGPGVEAVGFRPPEPDECDIDAGNPTDVLAGATLHAPTQVIEEVIRVYPDEEAAEAAYNGWIAFPSTCTFGLGIPMGAPGDVNELVGADRSVRYQAGDGAATATLIVAQVSDAVITTSVLGEPDLDPVEVGAFAVGKVLAALEA